MALIDQKKLLQHLILSMHSEGLINSQFHQLVAIKEATRGDYLVRAVITYCTSVKSLFIILTNQILQNNVDFYQLNVVAHDLLLNTSSIGAERVKLACAELIHASEENDADLCFQALYWAKSEFCQLQKKFEDLVQSLLDEGIVNQQFSHIQTLKTKEEPDYAVKLITSYFDDVEAMLSELTEHIDFPDADFKRLTAIAHEIKEKSLGIGAEHMKHASSSLILACDENNVKKFSLSLSVMKIEFDRTQIKLDAFVQMEKRIIRLESKQK